MCFSIKFEDGKEGLLRHLYVADLLHALLAAFLFFEQLALAGDVAAVALGQDVLAHLLHRLAGDDLRTDSGLDGDVELLTGEQLLELLAHAAAEGLGVVEMRQRGEGVNGFAVEQDVELHQLGGPEADGVVVERGIALGDGFELVVEVDDDLAQRHVEENLNTITRDEVLRDKFAAFAQTERHDVAQVGRRGDDGGADEGFLDVVDERLVGHAGGIVHLVHLALLVVNEIGDVGHRRDDVHVELAVEPLLDDLHVEQTQEAAAEAEAQSHRRLGLEGEGGVVELQLLERSAQVLKVLGLNGIDAGKDHRLDFLEARNGLRSAALDGGDGVAHLDLRRRLDAGDDVAHIARRELVARREVHLEDADLVGLVLLARVDETHLLTAVHGAVDNLEIGDDAPEGIEHGVEDERLEWGRGVALRRRDTFDDGVENVRYAFARARRSADDLLTLAAQEVDDLVLHLVGHRIGHVALVDDGNDLQIVVDGHIEIGDGLSLNALSGIHHQKRTLAGGNGTGHLIGEVHVARSVDKVQRVLAIVHLDGMTLDGDAALLLEIHVVEHLALRHLERTRHLEHAVCQRALAVIDVGNDAEITYLVLQSGQ